MNQSEQHQKSNTALREEAILQFWKENGIFEKTLAKESPRGEFVFYEGPPTANAKPALHHLEARVFKDAIPRYKTMQGYHVKRRAGWDTHGLPVELQIEKKLGLTSKKEIEQYGIAAFNKECKESVFTYIKDWELFTDRIGYWVDKEHAYYTFNTSYIESLWNILATVNQKGLVYKDYKVIPWCPRCGTALSSHELAQPGAYQDDKDLSVTVKFELVDEPGTYILAWTTTPWTLPGNVALAIGKNIEYITVTIPENFNPEEYGLENFDISAGKYIFAKETAKAKNEKLHKLYWLALSGHVEGGVVRNESLIGQKYKPLYPYLGELITGSEREKMENAYKVYAADFVTTEDGTGVVHTAVMYGADDFDLGTSVGLPKFHTVTPEGTFVAGTDFLEGRFVKDEDVAVDIIKDLAHRGLLFKKEKYEHSYPHCWRCKTPLIYYARDSWYIAMSKLRDQLVAENESINWEPAHIREGRFGEWLREIKDWAISRERYWGTPLPVWQSADGERFFVDSIDTLKAHVKQNNNTYFMMRHGEGTHNVTGITSGKALDDVHLTEKGKEQIMNAIPELREKNITKIYASPFFRTKESVAIIADALNIPPEQIVYDERIGDIYCGDYQGKPFDFLNHFTTLETLDEKIGNTGESVLDAKKRIGNFITDIDAANSHETILVVTHGIFFETIDAICEGADLAQSIRYLQTKSVKNGEVRSFAYLPLPRNDSFELDLHRPYIDGVVLVKNGKEFHRIKEVMDVWFDSGSMPFAQDHYPFENKAWIEGEGYPADFISEAIDQTRGWFYTLHAIGVLLGRGKAYKNVICLGHILDAQGKKMSKSIGNIVDPWEEMDKYGVDTLRLWMFAVNQPGDSKNYDEKTVLELNRQVFGLLYNVLSFYELYRDAGLEADISESTNVLDRWILARLHELIAKGTAYLDSYKVMEPVREFRAFIDDLSTWYLRRSRERIKDGDEKAKQTLYKVLKTLAVFMAPFAPFAAEDIWQKLRTDTDLESVHLVSWPAVQSYNEDIIQKMAQVRALCTLGNAERKRLAIPVRQPLALLMVKTLTLDEQYLQLIEEELNVKAVREDTALEADIALDTVITEELKREGDYRELVREVQDIRKAEGLHPGDIVSIELPEEKRNIVESFIEDFKKTVQAKNVSFGNGVIRLTKE